MIGIRIYSEAQVVNDFLASPSGKMKSYIPL